jgi:hypothetical protein
VTKLGAFQWFKVTKLNPSKPSPLFCQVKKSNELQCHLYPLGFQRGKVFVIVIVVLVPRAFQAAYRIHV